MQVSGTFCIMWPIVFNNVTNAWVWVLYNA